MIFLKDQTELLKEILCELTEIKNWTKIAGIPVLIRAINENLRDDEDKLVYELSDGNRSTREIVGELKKMGIKITHPTVANMWKRWAPSSLVIPSKHYKGRFKKLVSLENLGIELPRKRGKIKK